MSAYIIKSKDELTHYGVKGMKWGVRHDEDRIGYKYNKPGESGWIGLARALKARRNSNRNLRAAQKSRRDAANLRKAGYVNEAKAVEKVANVQQAKGEYKQAKKEFNRASNKAYSSGNPLKQFTDKGRRRYEKDWQTAMVKSGEMAIKKGKYIEAKGLLKGNNKKVNKGRYIAERAANAKRYNSIILKDVENGYTLKDAHNRHNKEYETAMNRQRERDAEERRKRGY